MNYVSPREVLPFFSRSFPGLRGLASVALGGSLLFAAGCSEEGAAQLPVAEEERAAPVDVQVVTVTRGPIAYVPEIGAHLLPLRAVDLGADVTARVDRIFVEEGEQVRRNQPLIRLDARYARAMAAQTEAMASSAQVQAAQYASEFERIHPLTERGAIAVSQADQLAASRDAARASAEASRSAAGAAAVSLRSYTIRAPFAGVVETIPTELGEVVSPQGSGILRLLDLSEVEARVRVAESQLPGIQEGGVATAELRSLGTHIEGRIVRVGYELDPLTHTASVMVRFPNADGRLRAGMFAYVSFPQSAPVEGLVMPATGVRNTATEAYVYTVEGNGVRRVVVQVRPINAREVVVLSGLEAGARVIVHSSAPLRDDVQVRVSAAPSAGQAPSAAPSAQPTAAPAPTPTPEDGE